ncbi:hypothetical protein CHLRE_16g681200v5 [Chlamydomonas reinhardtii]|uniref:Uncharacterized protein n=1 Tax=Chlamydomonas reinhardtii TaxID=3055 RepID=A0A2K3CV34_CHLRE|nr:uncharacterized protein CHLRE_16g681200v5 [Chlamydomonas reinhardtii]PNW72134.1 hypothetical protein CHLRE_16g681200v5 [Chlamydomonas reinhardtii]
MPVRPFKAAVAGACASLLLFGQPVSAAGIGSSGLLPQGMETPSTVVDVTKSKLGAADEVPAEQQTEKLQAELTQEEMEQWKKVKEQLKQLECLTVLLIVILFIGYWALIYRVKLIFRV